MLSDSLIGVVVIGVPPAVHWDRFCDGIAGGGGERVRGVGGAASGLTGETCRVLAEAAAEAAPGDVRRGAEDLSPPSLWASPPTVVGGAGAGCNSGS